MTFQDYKFIEEALQEAYDQLLDIYQSCDTSYSGDKNESKNDILKWNDKFNLMMEHLRELREEMIFTFKIED